MKKTKFKNIHSLEDIHKTRLKLKKKIRLTEKSISRKTDLGKLLIRSLEKKANIPGGMDSSPEVIGYLLPLGLKYVLGLFKRNISKKQFRRLLIFSAIGGALALSVYKIITRKKTDTEAG